MRAKSQLSKLGILIVAGVRTAAHHDASMTVEECASYCISFGYLYFDVECGGECYRSNVLQAGSVPAPQSDCDMACNGNASEICGGPTRLSLYMT
jgi:hypothetical protein